MTHSMIGLAAGALVDREKLPRRFWLLSLACPALPDLDVLAFTLGIPYADPLGHRGFFHSLPCALLLGVVVASLFSRHGGIRARAWWGWAVYFFAITASHGILDTFTNGGLGIALLSPMNNTRFFSPWAPIQVAPIGIRRFFQPLGLAGHEERVPLGLAAGHGAGNALPRDAPLRVHASPPHPAPIRKG